MQQELEGAGLQDLVVTAFYAYVHSGKDGLASILVRMSEDERTQLLHLAATFYRDLANEENALQRAGER